MKNRLSKLLKNRMASKILLLTIGILLFASFTYAAQCSGTFTTATTANVGELFNVSFFNAQSWPTNATVSVPDGLLLAENATKNTSPFQPTKWQLNSTIAGTYQINLTAIGTSQTCDKNTSVQVVLVVGTPSITIIPQDLVALKLNKAAAFSTVLNNTGNGTAYNIYESIESDAFGFKNTTLASIASGSNNETQFSITPTKCGQGILANVIAEYKDGNGLLQSPATASDTFDVIGSDLKVLSVTPSTLTPVAGNTITLDAVVKNVNGTDTAVNGKVTFYYDQVQDANKIAEVNLAGNTGNNISVNDEATANTTWTVTNAGNHTIIAVVSDDNECTTTNNQEQSSVITASAAPVVDTTPAPSGGSGGSRGGTSAGTVTSVSKDGPSSATKFFVVAAGTSANVRVTDSRIPVTLLQVDVANRVQDVEISVTKLDKEPASKIEEGTGKVYSYLKVDTVNLEDKDVSKAVFRFKVEKNWLNDNNYKEDEVVLARYHDGKWNSLSTIVLLRENNQITYSAESPGFSTFAILARNADERAAAAGEKKAEPKVEEKKEPEVKQIEKKDNKTEQKQPEAKPSESAVGNALTGAAVALKDTFVGKHPATVGIVFAVLVALVVLSFWYKRMGREEHSVKSVKTAARAPRKAERLKSAKPLVKAKKGKRKK